MNKVICLHTSDNVGVALSNLKKGDIISHNSLRIKLLDNIDFGHKVALMPIEKEKKIIKYGVSIGIVTQHILAGSHVHTQNMESLYMKQFTKK
ncbi:altronate dehydratase small subunit [Maribacter vaceletii]|uniref:Altronate dehydratase small subunit n=1 Tax=Maribacter vaceletii TaxID=1206816 RepID=A0A495DTP1_9FLAO|nr:UxaA family hydrolase [Maribacter vaceletii]RKR07996.1 altronate dehydratase small subunit [Maribacter vaceletii]